jgi:hypothetical protein
MAQLKTDERADAEYRYRNTLKWIRTVAGLHYFGGAFDPEHMRTLANLAANALAGEDVGDHDEAMAKAKVEAQVMATEMGLHLIGDDDE